MLATLLAILACFCSVAVFAEGTTQVAAQSTGNEKTVNRWYVALKTSLAYTDIENVSHNATIGTGLRLEGLVDGRLEDGATEDYTAGLGIAVGKRFGNWLVEAEYAHRFNTDWDVVAPTPSIQTVTNVFSNVATTSFSINVARRGVISRLWSWELGGTVGFLRHDIESEFIERAVPGIRPQFLVRSDNRETEFALGILAGLARDMRGPWTFNMRYTYLPHGDYQTDAFPMRAARLQADPVAHSLQFSIERNLSL